MLTTRQDATTFINVTRRNSFQEHLIVGEKMFAHTWLGLKGKYYYHLMMLEEDVRSRYNLGK